MGSIQTLVRIRYDDTGEANRHRNRAQAFIYFTYLLLYYSIFSQLTYILNNSHTLKNYSYSY